MIRTRTIAVGFFAMLAGYLLLRMAILQHYLTLSQVIVVATAVAVAILDAKLQKWPLLRYAAPREDKDQRLFLFGKWTAFASAGVLAALCLASTLPSSSYYWNPDEKLAVRGLPDTLKLNRPQIKLLERFVEEYERCANAEEHQKLLEQMRSQRAQSLSLWTAAFGYTRNSALRHDLLPLLEETTGLQLRPTGELDDAAALVIVGKLQQWAASQPGNSAGLAKQQ